MVVSLFFLSVQELKNKLALSRNHNLENSLFRYMLHQKTLDSEHWRKKMNTEKVRAW